VLLSLDRGIAYRLNGTGKTVWDLVRQGRRHDQILDSMVATFAAARSDIEKDVDHLLAELVANRLLEMVMGEGA
jgi:hypothetical protein